MENLQEEGFVKMICKEGVARIVFYHPQKNSLPTKILQELTAQILAASADKNIKIMVIQSEGEHVFCSGASFAELSEIQNLQEGIQFFSGFAHVINAMKNSSKLIIARVQGKCIGGGVGIAAAADYAIATSEASVKLSELAVGIGPFVVGPAVERKIGLAAFSQLAIHATHFQTADWALQKGLFAAVLPSMEEMDAEIEKLANILCASSQDAMADLKKIFWQGTEHWDQLLLERAGISGKLILSDAAKNFIKNFRNKGAR